MKISHSILILVIALFASQLLSSQNTRFDLNRTISLDPNKDSQPKNITLRINEKTVIFSLNITCKVRLGDLSIEIYDPNGEKQGEFSIESQMEKKLPLSGEDKYEREIVEGNISKEITDPINGNWIVKLIPKKALASIKIQSQFINKD